MDDKQQAQSSNQTSSAYQEWLQQQIAQQQQNQPVSQSQPATPIAQVQSDPNAYQQHLEQIQQQAGEDQPVFSQPWLPPEQQVTKQAEILNQPDYQPTQLAQAPVAQPAPPPQEQPQPQPQQPQPQQPQPQTQTQTSIEVGPHATVDHSHDNDFPPQNSWKLTQTIGGGIEVPGNPVPAPPKKSHKKLTVFMSTLIFAAVGTAIVVVFYMISQVGAKTLSCHDNGQNNEVANLTSYELTLNVKLAGETFSDITTNVSLLFSNGIDAQNYVNSGGNGLVSDTMVVSDEKYIKNVSGAVIDGSRVNYFTTYRNDYIGLLGGVGPDLSSYHGTSEQLLNDVRKNLENVGYSCSFK